MSLRWTLFLSLSLAVGCVTAKKQQQAASRAQLGQAYLRERNPAGAVLVLEEAVQLDPYNFEAWQNLALAYMSQGVYEQAEKAFKRSIRLAEGRAEIHNNYGLLLMKMERREEAIAQFEVALKDLTYRSPALAMSNLGYALYLEQRHEEALRYLSEAIARAPQLCPAQFNRGLVYRELGDPELALVDFQDAAERCGEEATGAYYQAAELLLAQGDAYAGCIYLEELAELEPHTQLGRQARELRARSCRR